MKASSIRYTTCEKQFVGKSIDSGIRLDGRQAYDYRNLELKFGLDYGYCEVSLGDTKVLAQTSCELVKPRDSRPTDGQLFINVDLSPMASPAFESGRLSNESIEVNRLIERVLKESRPVDTESLCVLAGEKVWSVRVDVLILNHDGNLLDCCCIAAITSLAHFRRPDVTVVGHEVTIHSFEEKEPVALNVHHMPMCITFGFIENEKNEQQLIIDPEEKEESIISGTLMMAFNVQNEVCCVQMNGGVCLDYEQVLNCANVAALKAEEITAIVKEALEEDKERRAPKRKIQKVGLKTPSQPRQFITKTTAEPTEAPIPTTYPEQNDRNDAAIINDEENNSTAELANYLGKNTVALGEGGRNAWVISSDDEMETGTREEKTINIDVDDSEEEDVVVLNANDLKGKTNVGLNESTMNENQNDNDSTKTTTKRKRKKNAT